MKVLLDIKDTKAPFFMELLKHFSFVRVKILSDKKAKILADLKESIEEVKLHKQGKIKLKSAEEFLKEL